MKMNLIEMEGFLHGKGIPGDLKVNESNASYLVRKFSEMEAKCAALAAENAALKSCVDGWCDMPATDAFLAEVRAQGVDSSIETIMIHLNHQYQPIASAIHFLKIHADQLRQGGAV